MEEPDTARVVGWVWPPDDAIMKTVCVEGSLGDRDTVACRWWPRLE